MDEESDPGSIDALSLTNRNMRLQAIQSAEMRANPQNLSFLIAALHDDVELCEAAIDALGEARNTQAIEPLAALLDNADVSLRTRAVRALRQIGGESVVNALAEALHNNMAPVRRAAIVALGKIQHDQSLTLLIGALDDADTRVRISAILTLAELGDERAVPALEEMDRCETSDEESKQVQEYVVYAIRRIHERNG